MKSTLDLESLYLCMEQYGYTKLSDLYADPLSLAHIDDDYDDVIKLAKDKGLVEIDLSNNPQALINEIERLIKIEEEPDEQILKDIKYLKQILYRKNIITYKE